MSLLCLSFGEFMESTSNASRFQTTNKIYVWLGSSVKYQCVTEIWCIWVDVCCYKCHIVLRWVIVATAFIAAKTNTFALFRFINFVRQSYCIYAHTLLVTLWKPTCTLNMLIKLNTMQYLDCSVRDRGQNRTANIVSNFLSSKRPSNIHKFNKYQYARAKKRMKKGSRNTVFTKLIS